MPEYWYLYLVLGLVGGVISGALGVGSGIIVVPVLVVMCGFAQKSAQGVALAVMVPMALFGAIRYRLNPKIELDLVVAGLIALTAIGGVYIGTSIASALPGSVLRKAFSVLLIIAAVRMFTMK